MRMSLRLIAGWANYLAIALILTLVATNPARSELVIDITQGNVQPLPVAISDFHSETETAGLVGQRIAEVIRADLERSGLFAPIDSRAFLQKPADLQVTPVFSN